MGERDNNLHNARYTAAGCKHLAPVSLLTPGDRPPTVRLAVASASLNRRRLLLLLQCARNERRICSGSSGDLSWSRCRIGVWTRRQSGRERGNVCLFYLSPVCEGGCFEALVYAQVIVRSDRSLSKKTKQINDGRTGINRYERARTY